MEQTVRPGLEQESGSPALDDVRHLALFGQPCGLQRTSQLRQTRIVLLVWVQPNASDPAESGDVAGGWRVRGLVYSILDVRTIEPGAVQIRTDEPRPGQ